jgi:hypothetical protein
MFELGSKQNKFQQLFEVFSNLELLEIDLNKQI